MSESLFSQTQLLAHGVAEGSIPDFSPYKGLYDPDQHVPMPEFVNNEVGCHALTGNITAVLAQAMLTTDDTETRITTIFEEPEPVQDLAIDDFAQRHLWNQLAQLRHDLGHTFTVVGDTLFATATWHLRTVIDQFIALMEPHEVCMNEAGDE